MSMQLEDVLPILEGNYQKAIALMPADLAAEFKNKIIRPKDLKEYAGQIAIAIQFRDENSMQVIENWMVEHFNKRQFGHRLYLLGIDPVKIYETLLKGIYDYK